VHPIERLRYVARASSSDQRLLVRETASALRGLHVEPAGLVVACRRIVERHPTSGPLWWFCASLLASSDPFATAYRLATEMDDDPTADHLVDLLPDDATVCVIGWPDLTGDAILRRGDVRVLAIDVADRVGQGDGAAFVRRLQRSDVEAEAIGADGVAAAVLASDLVLVEASAVGRTDALALPLSRALASIAWCSEVPAWLVAGQGRRLPEPMVTTMVERLADDRGPWRAEAEPVPVGLFGTVVGPAGASAPDAPGTLDAECPMAFELLRPSPI